MAHIMSISEEISNLTFVSFPTRPSKKCVKIVRVGNLIFGLMADGSIACSRPLGNFAYPANSKAFPWMGSVIDALYRLGVISKDAMDRHNHDARSRGERENRRRLAGNLTDNAKEFGLALTARQKAKLASARHS